MRQCAAAPWCLVFTPRVSLTLSLEDYLPLFLKTQLTTVWRPNGPVPDITIHVLVPQEVGEIVLGTHCRGLKLKPS